MKKILVKGYCTPNQREALDIIQASSTSEECMTISRIMRDALQKYLQTDEVKSIIQKSDPDFYKRFYKIDE